VLVALPSPPSTPLRRTNSPSYSQTRHYTATQKPTQNQKKNRKKRKKRQQADAINSIVKAAGITVEPYWPSIFAKLFAKKKMDDLITNVGAGGGAPAPAAGGGGGAAPAAGGGGGKAAAKEAEKSEEDEDMGFSLFD
jgi:large subunit ribosomal protein LP1